MKKKVLFALIALFSFLSTWAAGPTLQGLTSIKEDLDVWVITDGTTLPTASAGTVTFYDAQSKVVTAITEVGWYCAKIKVGDTYIAIPFQAWKAVDFDVIDDQESFEESRDNGVLSMYYSDPNYVTTDDQDANGVAQWSIAAANGELYNGDDPTTYGARKHYQGVGFPWIVFASTEEYPCQVRFVYSDASGTEVETNVYDPWASFYTGTNSGNVSGTPIFFSTTDKKYGIASAQGELGTGQVYAYTQDDEVFTNDDNNRLDEDALTVYWTPQLSDEPDFFVYDWKLSQSTLPYNSENQYNALRGLISFIPELGELGDNDDWSFTVKMGENANGTAVTEVKDVGSYFVQVYMGGDNADQFEIGTGKVFKITAYNLTIGSSVTYKQIGDPDPTPEYGLMYDNNVSTEAANLTITGLKLVRKFAPSLNRVSTVADDYVGAQWDYYIDIRDAQIVDANGDVNPNYAISSASVEGTLEVTKKYLRPGEFRVNVDAEYTYDGLAKEPTTITVEQDKNYDKRGEADYTADWQEVEIDGNFDISYMNNINADAYGQNSGTEAAPVYDWMTDELVLTKDADLLITDANRAIVILTPTADGIYTSRLALGNNKFLPANEADQVKQIAGDFKIKQRDIATATIADIPAVIFNNAEQTPEPKVTYNNGTADGLTLGKGTDFTYGYDCNTYVTDEEYKTKATITATMVDAKYSGNWFGTQDKNFTINPFVFTLLPQDGEKPYLDNDPSWDDEDWAKAQLVARPSAEMVDAEGNALQFPGDPVYELLKEGWSISRAVGEFIAVYDINIKNAELKESDPASVSDPAHNYVMTVETGTFEIKKAAEYYASSKFVTREFRSGDNTIPFVDEDNNADGNAFYLYRRTVEDQEVTYVQIPETDDLYLEIKASGRISGNQRVAQNPALQPANSPFAIEPIIANSDDEVQYEYEIGVLPRDAFQHTTGDYAETPEGIFTVTRRKVTIMADNQTSVFGENYKDLTYKVYDGHITRDEVTAETPESEVQLVTNGAYAAHTIAYFNNLSCNIAQQVDNATKPLTANVTADIVVSTAASNGGTLAQRNPNYDIQFVDGTYTVTPSTNQYFVYVELNKDYDGTTGNWDKTVTWTFGTSKETAQPIEGDNPPVADEQIGVNWGEAGEPTEVDDYPLTDEMITRPEGANVIGGYPVNYGGLATISVAGEVVITVKNLGAQYPVPPTLSFDNKRVSVTGATFDEIAANGDFVLTYTKPEVGFIKKGATVQVEFNGKAFGTPEGQVVSADDWAWVANYTKVTVKSGKVMVTAPEDITLDIVAFNKANYQAAYDDDAEINDELIRDYAGTAVNKVTITCSEQEYTIKGDQWYSMVLPFEATVREIQSLFNGFVGVDQLNQTASASKASEIRFTYTTKNVPANNPFIAKTDNDFTFTGATISRGDDKIMIEYPENEGKAGEIAIEDANGNKFIGTYNAFFAPDDETKLDDKGREITSYYDLVTLGSGSISPASPGAYVRPLGAYIKVAEGVDNAHAPLRIVIEEADGTETVIEAVEAEGAAEGAEGWYTINGVKLEGEPATSGTYIFNGKKVFIQK